LGCKTIESWATGSQAVGCFGMNGDCRPISPFLLQPTHQYVLRGPACVREVCLSLLANEETSMAREVGQIIARGDHKLLIRVYLGRDQETRKRNAGCLLEPAVTHMQFYGLRCGRYSSGACCSRILWMVPKSRSSLEAKCVADRGTGADIS